MPPLRLALVVVVALALALPATAAASHTLIDHISRGPAGGNGASNADFAGASVNGLTTFFVTPESLVTSDTDGLQDVYQRTGDVTSIVSTGPIGGNGLFVASFAGASQDGTRVFFSTSESLVTGDTDGAQDVYERSGGTTTPVSTGPMDGGALTALFAGTSADGLHVFFRTAEAIVPEDGDNFTDVFARFGGVTTLVSTGPDGGDGAFGATFGGNSQDGARVFFATAEQLITGPTGDMDSHIDVYEYSSGTTTLVSTGPDGGNGAFDATFRGATPDGQHVFFTTNEQLTTDDGDSSTDLYEGFGGTTTLLSIGPSGGSGAFAVTFRGVSQTGVRVFFSTAEALTTDDLDTTSDVYESAGGTTTLISTGPGALGGSAPISSYAGMSADGTRVYFHTTEQLVTDDADSVQDVYERASGSTQLISWWPGAGNGAFAATFRGVSANGARIFFESAEVLGSGDSDATQDVYERFNNIIWLVSSGGTGAPGATFSARSDDGTRVIFVTADQLTATDTDSAQDIYGAAILLPYPRPSGASPLRAPFSQAFAQCTSPNVQHAAPLAVGACNPFVRESPLLTIGSLGKALPFTRMEVLPGIPATPEDEADITVVTKLNDVRNVNQSDYVGKVLLEATSRITDRGNGGSAGESGTVQDFKFGLPIDCVATVDTTTGSICNVTSTFDSLFPGVATEGRRMVLEMPTVYVDDVGPDGQPGPPTVCPPVCGTGDESNFLRQGLWAP